LIKLICDDGTEIYGKPENDYSSLYIFGHIYGKIYDQYGDWGTIFDCPQDQYFDAAEFRYYLNQLIMLKKMYLKLCLLAVRLIENEKIALGMNFLTLFSNFTI
jgi:hypothetical protein